LYHNYTSINSNNILRNGNGTIDRYPLPREGKLGKILCISKEVFEKLIAALGEFEVGLKLALPKPKPSFAQKPPKSKPLAAPRRGDRNSLKDKCTGSFEPSNILYTRASDFWRLRNLHAWFKEQDSYEDLRYLESHLIKI